MTEANWHESHSNSGSKTAYLKTVTSRTDAGTAVQQTIKLGDAANCSLKTHTVSKEIVETLLMDFPGVRYHSKFRLMTWHPMGIFDRALADKLRECIEWEEHVQNAPFDRYADLSGVTQVEISQQCLVEIASRRHRVLQPVKSAFFADKRHTFLIARIYESLMEDAVAITVRAFHERELAAHWLGVPLAILCPPADGPCE